MNTGAKRIVFGEIYPHPQSEALWCGAGNSQRFSINGAAEWIHLPWNSLPSIANIQLVRLELGQSSSTRVPDAFVTVTRSLKVEESPGSKIP
jgi:hypothetical protein